MDVKQSIAAVRELLLQDERIACALLFGSAAKEAARRMSDLDVGVVARARADVASLEREHLELVARLSRAAGRDVDLVILDRAEPLLGRQAFLHGRALFDRDPKRRAEVLERILREYFDGEYHRRLRNEALEQRLALRRG
ncbi:MAG TPA: nucleotidyltransferase domain-containing protein [Burkholderiales bacterium]|nr:nucleotidyltransferase domain-containing protein [Burkholderiales bacterium]